MKIMREHLASAVVEAHRLAASGCPWPGWDISGTPLVLHSPEVAYTVGHPSPPEGYEEMEPVAGRGMHGGPPLTEMVANTALTIAGTMCALMTFSSAPLTSIGGFARLILHECFHAYHRQGLYRMAVPNSVIMNHYPESDPENNAMSIVENRLLCSALRGEAAAGAAARFVAVRQARHRWLQEKGLADICVYEQGSEFNEGTPTYVEVRAGKPVSEVIDDLEKANVAGEWAASRRFYSSGAAIALLLDILVPGWHGKLAAGGRTLQSLLAEAVGEPLPDAVQVLDNAGYADILASEQASEKERKARIDSMYGELMSGPGVPVEIEVPEGAFTLFDPNNILIVKTGTRFHTCITGLRSPDGIVVDIIRLCLEDAEPHRLLVRLPERPEISRGDTLRVSGPGLKVAAPHGVVEGPGPDGGYRVRFSG